MEQSCKFHDTCVLHVRHVHTLSALYLKNLLQESRNTDPFSAVTDLRADKVLSPYQDPVSEH